MSEFVLVSPVGFGRFARCVRPSDAVPGVLEARREPDARVAVVDGSCAEAVAAGTAARTSEPNNAPSSRREARPRGAVVAHATYVETPSDW